MKRASVRALPVVAAMNISRTFGATVLATALLMPCAFAKPRTPKVGSPERVAIMNAMRRVLGNGRNKAIITANHLKVERNWAFLSGGFQYANGVPLEEQYRQGSGTNFSGLLQRMGKRWRIRKWTHHGDVVTPEFIAAFPQAPRAIFD